MDVDGDDLGNDFTPRKVKVVFIMARVHPGETPSSFVIQGLLDFLVSSHDIAASLREHIVFTHFLEFCVSVIVNVSVFSFIAHNIRLTLVHVPLHWLHVKFMHMNAVSNSVIYPLFVLYFYID